MPSWRFLSRYVSRIKKCPTFSLSKILLSLFLFQNASLMDFRTLDIWMSRGSHVDSSSILLPYFSHRSFRILSDLRFWIFPILNKRCLKVFFNSSKEGSPRRNTGLRVTIVNCNEGKIRGRVAWTDEFRNCMFARNFL